MNKFSELPPQRWDVAIQTGYADTHSVNDFFINNSVASNAFLENFLWIIAKLNSFCQQGIDVCLAKGS